MQPFRSYYALTEFVQRVSLRIFVRFPTTAIDEVRLYSLSMALNTLSVVLRAHATTDI
jgi:hypothetical protein